MHFKRGDIILVRFPNSDLKTYKKRPALVVQADNLQTGLNQKIIAMITSNLGRSGSSRVVVCKDSPIGQKMGLLTDSVIVTDNLATVLEREVDKVIGHCMAMEEVDVALRKTLAL
jgi:mRNA interferase MazF